MVRDEERVTRLKGSERSLAGHQPQLLIGRRLEIHLRSRVIRMVGREGSEASRVRREEENLRACKHD